MAVMSSQVGVGGGAAAQPLSLPHPLREYALLADGERGAVIGPRGDVVWLCAPRWDSDAVFSSLIGGAGGFSVTPVGRVGGGGPYEHGSRLWRSRWGTDTGVVECREALAFPGDASRVVLLRRVMAVDADARVTIALEPAAGFGEHRMQALRRAGGGWEGACGPLRVRLSGDVDEIGPDGDGRRLTATVDVPRGGHHDLVLELSDTGLPDERPDPDRVWAQTENAWRSAVPALGDSLAPRDARHSYAVLRGLTSSGGGMVAAATMSLPERAEQGRNYDYRYVWIRDQCYAGQAVAVDGPHPLLDDAVGFVADRVLADGPHLRPAYTVTGAAVPDERHLDLPGYPGGRGVAGNHANAQFQLDALGEALLLFAAAARHDRLDSEHYRSVTTTVAAIRARRGDPDAGIWELDAQRWTHSALTCVAGLRAMAGHAAGSDAGAWTALADAIMADTAATSVHPSGRWQRSTTDPGLDAALLLPPLRGALPATDPRTVATLAAIDADLAEDLYLYRFRHDDRPLAAAEGAFVLCGFLMALARHQQGDTVAAVRWFERNRAACGPPGIFTEEYDIAQRQLRGNLPQAFVHALMLETSIRLARPWPTP